MPIKHAKTSAVADAADTGLVLPVDWNADHTGESYATIQDEGVALTQRAKLNFIGSQVSAADDAANVRTNITVAADLYNFLTNPGFEIWQRGAGAFTASSVYTADRWVQILGGTSTISTTKAGIGEVDTIADTDSRYSLKAVYTHGSAISRIEQKFGSSGDDLIAANQLRGRTLTVAVRVRANAVSAVRLRLVDSVGNGPYSSYHTGGSTFETLTATRTIDAGATFVGVEISLDATVTAYFDNATLVIGSTAQTYYPLHPAEEWERCQRYYERYDGAAAAWTIILDSVNGAHNVGVRVWFAARKPVLPTVSKAGTWAVTNIAQPTVDEPRPESLRVFGVAAAAGAVNANLDSTDDNIISEANP